MSTYENDKVDKGCQNQFNIHRKKERKEGKKERKKEKNKERKKEKNKERKKEKNK